MKTATFAIAAALAAGLVTAASAQDAQIPTWANPSPANPVATDGSSLTRRGVEARAAQPADFVAVYPRDAAATPAAPAHRVIHVWGSDFVTN